MMLFYLPCFELYFTVRGGRLIVSRSPQLAMRKMDSWAFQSEDRRQDLLPLADLYYATETHILECEGYRFLHTPANDFWAWAGEVTKKGVDKDRWAWLVCLALANDPPPRFSLAETLPLPAPLVFQLPKGHPWRSSSSTCSCRGHNEQARGYKMF